jgi:DNA uptake protein ComE-like DNA-binding protein
LEKDTRPALMVHEWLAITTIIGFLGMLTTISIVRTTPPLTPDKEHAHLIVNPFIKISIEGAVEHPGSYNFKKGARVKDALAEAKPLPEADLKRINLEAKLRKGQIIHLPKIELLTIYIQGAVDKPGALQVPKGTRLIDLIKTVSFPKNAVLEPLQKKRRLRDNEVIHIKIKKGGPTG